MGGRGATSATSKASEQPENARVAASRRKLERLKKEFDDMANPAENKPLGQPRHLETSMGRRLAKQEDKFIERKFNKLNAIKAQEEKLERVEYREKNRALGLTANGGLQKSVQNIGAWEKRLNQQLEIKQYLKDNKIKTGNQYKAGIYEKFGTTYKSSKLKEARETVNSLRTMSKQASAAKGAMSSQSKKLVESGAVKQWAKKPTYYFVNGLRKVAVEMDSSGKFKPSSRYPAISQSDKDFLKKLLG